jgi:serine/threonine protein kinase
MIGTILSNRYKITEKLGSGGMAWVYLAQDLREQRQVAIKILYPQHSQDLSFLQRFMQEARLVMSLSECNPDGNIVCVLDYGSDRDTHYLVMEYVQGRDLGQVLNERGALPWQEALGIARQVAMALDHAHQQGIVHRDIKPGNIMLSADERVHVLDFGIARAKGAPELTLAGFVGSPHYAAPEQAMGEAVDVRADIYSLGIVLYRMLSGKLPFHGNTPWAIANQHIASPPPPLEAVCPDLPAPVLHLVKKAMAKRPEDRFQTPTVMIHVIDEVLAGHDLPGDEPPAAALSPDELDQRAQEALQAREWQKAVDLLNQILQIDPDDRDAAEQLTYAGQQIRLAALYQVAQRMLQLEQWDEVLIQLDEIAEIDPDYRDIKQLQEQARNSQRVLAEEQAALSDFPTQVGTPGSGYALPATEASTGQQTPGLEPSRRQEKSRRKTWLWLLVALLALAVAGLGYALSRAPDPSAAMVPTTLTPATAVTLTAPPSPTARLAATQASPSPTLTPRPVVTVGSPTEPPTATPTATLTPLASPSAEPSPPAGGGLTGQIAFPRFDATRGTYDVYTCQVDGSNCRRLVAQASQPDFLPDGTQIVVHSWQPGEKGLVLHVLAEQRIWRITAQIEAARPSVDFRGENYVYYSRQEADRQPRLYRTFGLETRPILREANGIQGLSPSWMPDGRILYSGCWQDSCGILVMQADGTQPRQVAAGTAEMNPEAAPNGRQVVFMSQRDGNWEIYTINLDGSGLRRLTQNPANDGLPTWSPDGRHIAFVSNRNGSWAVWAMAADGSDAHRLFDIGGPLDGQVRGTASYEINGWVEERISWATLP